MRFMLLICHNSSFTARTDEVFASMGIVSDPRPRQRL